MKKIKLFTPPHKHLSVSLLGLLLLTAVTMLTISCKKDFINDVNAHEMYLSATPPTVSNGMLYFNDTASFNEYYNYLEELCEAYDDSLLYFDEDSLLLTIESNFEGFTSLRSYFYDETDEIVDFNEFLDVVYSHDEILNSILNQFGEMRIGSKVYVIFGSGDFYEIPSTLNSAIQLLRTKDKKEIEIVHEILNEEGVLLHSDRILMNTTTKKGEYDNYIEPYAPIYRTDCNQFYASIECYLEAFGSADTSNYDVEWWIDWGDGTPEINKDITNFDLEHTYEEENVFNIIVKVRWEDYNNSGEYRFKEFEPKVIDTRIACAKYDTDTSQWVVTQDERYAASALLAFKGKNGVFDLRSKIVAKTYNWKWNSSKARWEKEKIVSSLAIDYKFRTAECNNLESDVKEKDDKKRKKRIVRKRKWFGYHSLSNNENYSSHYSEFPNENVHIELLLTPCK